ncbi:TPA: hypothetical protein ACH3X3_006877 [Trebouxia sp. C0006]
MKQQLYRNLSLFCCRQEISRRKRLSCQHCPSRNASILCCAIMYKCCRGQLYCALTCQVMQAKLETVKKHMSGKRFAAAKAEFETDNRELMEEPDVSDTASSGQDQEEAEQAIDAELAIDVQDDGASPMEEDVLPEAACPEILSTEGQADDTVTVVSETSTKTGLKRKQQHSSTHKLPRPRGKPIKRKARQSNGT